MKKTGLTYGGDAGINYEDMDPFKIEAQEEGLKVALALNFPEITRTRGESAYVSVTPKGELLAQVVEGLGSENQVADWLYDNRSLNFFREIGWSNTATALNDLITTGAAPWTYMMFLAVGASS
ncbi:MAG: hypothetical protein Q7S57_01635 [bacterium]|nr:hypothetical protein [bacterium]